MFNSTSPVAKLRTLLAVFTLSVLSGACGLSTTEADTQVLTEGEETQFPPMANSLALSSPMPRFILLPLNNPGVVPVELAEHMRSEDIIAGVVVDGQARAYPLWIFGNYHVVNDTIGDTPVMLAYCELCSGSAACRPVVEGFEGRTLSFQIHGLARGTFTVYDYQTQTVWSPFTGRTLEGKLHPSRMERIPLMMETWGDWVKQYPDTEVVFASKKLREREHMSADHAQVGHPFIPQTFMDMANMSDNRLAANALVFGIANLEGNKSMAFPVEFLEGKQEVVKYPFDNAYYLLKEIGKFGVAAFRLQKDQEDKTYHQASQDPFRLADNEGRVWNEFGKSLNEKGEDLAVADGYMTEWYEWVTGYPESEIAH